MERNAQAGAIVACDEQDTKHYESAVASETSEQIFDLTGGKEQNGAIVACDEQDTKHYESAVASETSEQIFDLTGGKEHNKYLNIENNK